MVNDVRKPLGDVQGEPELDQAWEKVRADMRQAEAKERRHAFQRKEQREAWDSGRAFDARLTSAGFLGRVDLRVTGQGVAIRGLRVSHRLLVTRWVVQWLLAIIGAAGLVTGVGGAAYVLVAALVFSFVAYLALWWTAEVDSVSFDPGPATGAKVGWAMTGLDALWLFNLLTAISLLLTALSDGGRIVSFAGPAAKSGHPDVRYILVAKEPALAAGLVVTLTGPT